MCGICGFVDFNATTELPILTEMVSTLNHRGPDDYGTYIDNSSDASIGFGHTRLSILDLSQAGHQPMHFEHLSIVLNGEVYNFAEIRNKLQTLGHTFKSDSDTEVVLHAFCEWGVESVKYFIGMFAFVILDKKDQKMYFFRDRAGVKPLYYHFHNNLLLFGSELKPICQHPSFVKEIDDIGLGYYFKMGYIPAPFSIYKNTYKLKGGDYAILDLETKKINVTTYWNVNTFYKQPRLNLNYQAAKSKFHELLKSSVDYRMVADVPVGVFLSGGYDSTAVAAILQKGRKDRIKTFTIGFEEGNNEAPYAKETAEYLGTDHTEYICTTKEAQAIVPRLPYYYDEPFSDSSAIPTMLVSKVARQQVTVALSADGGDETLCGYESHQAFNQLIFKVNKLKKINKVFSSIALKTILVFTPKRSRLYSKFSLLKNLLNAGQMTAAELREQMLSMHPNVFKEILNISYPKDLFSISQKKFESPLSVAMAIDYQSYMQDDILTKVDRASMSVALEGREPLLDHRLIEFAARIPNSYKYDGQITKRILKDIVHEYIPKEMMERPKTGFTLPIYDWLRGDLSYLLDQYLSESSLLKSGIFNVLAVQKLITKFRRKQLHDESIIWKVLQFQLWYERWIES